jgi:glycosyltransferase domain-containing protein
MTILEEVSIIIPTKNRSDWCIRLVNYYKNLNFPGKVIFCDSSDSAHSHELKSYIGAVNSRSIIQLELPNASVHLALQFGIEHASRTTKYFVQSGDDDFYSIEGLASAAKFLDDHSDFVACLGKGVIAGYILKGDQIEQQWLRKYGSSRSLQQKNPDKRVFEVTSHYYNLEYSMRPTKLGLKLIREVNNFLGSLAFEESTTVEFCSVICVAYAGKIKVLREPFLMRIDHAARPNRNQKSAKDLLDFKVSQLETVKRFHLHLRSACSLASPYELEDYQVAGHYLNLISGNQKRFKQNPTFIASANRLFDRLMSRISALFLDSTYAKFYDIYERKP